MSVNNDKPSESKKGTGCYMIVVFIIVSLIMFYFYNFVNGDVAIMVGVGICAMILGSIRYNQ